jgi:hypothetical protein
MLLALPARPLFLIASAPELNTGFVSLTFFFSAARDNWVGSAA